jgi:hypothetical protein
MADISPNQMSSENMVVNHLQLQEVSVNEILFNNTSSHLWWLKRLRRNQEMTFIPNNEILLLRNKW